MDDYLSKPIDVEALAASLRKATKFRKSNLKREGGGASELPANIL
jgi:hypothetical protein